MAPSKVAPGSEGGVQSGVPHQFDQKEYDVTDAPLQACLAVTCPLHWMPIVPGVMGTKKIILEAEEAVYKVDCCIYHIETRRPYGELGSVDEANCCGCIGVASGLSKGAPVCPGCGCEKDLVAEIVAELKARMKERGDTGQIQRQEVMMNEIKRLSADVADTKECVRLLCEHFKIPLPPPTAHEMVR